jgi:hypothetical protein
MALNYLFGSKPKKYTEREIEKMLMETKDKNNEEKMLMKRDLKQFILKEDREKRDKEEKLKKDI